jgi:hypothetical protein
MSDFLTNLQAVIFKDMDLMSFTIVLMFIAFILMFAHAQIKGTLNWIDLIKKPGSSAISLTKLIQLVGGMIATWIMVKLTMDNKVTWDLFAIYLAYVGSVEGFSKFVSAKYGMPSRKDEDGSK